MKLLIFGLFGLLTHPASSQEITDVQNTIVSLFDNTDARNWTQVKSIFSERVFLDYSSMTGLSGSDMTPDQIVEAWKILLPGFDETHHKVKDFQIQINGNQAKASCQGTALHHIDNERDWIVEGSYDFELAKTDDLWTITKMKFNFAQQSGNLELPKLAMERAAHASEQKSTSSNHKEKVRQFFKSLEDEDVDALTNLFASDAVHINPYHSGLFPEGAVGRFGIRAYWQPVFPNFEGMRFEIDEDHWIEEGDKIFVKYKGKIKLRDGAGTYENDYYSTFRFNSEGEITEYVEIFNPINAAKAFGFLGKLYEQTTNTNNTKKMKKINFESEGLNLVGNLYYPENYDINKSYPAVIVSGSWTTVKEQMAGLYAEKLAQKGFVTLAFDFRNFGESEGEPKFYESPNMKKEDIKNAVDYLIGLEAVDSDKIGVFGVCAGAMYSLMAASEDDRISSIVTAASWLHDAEAVKLFYGGAQGVQQKISEAQNAKINYAKNGVVEYIPSISEVDSSAAMYGPYDYYLNPKRGAIPEWSAEKFAVMSWEDWLTADPMTTAQDIKCPTLMIHSDGAVLPQYTKNYFKNISATDKELFWMNTNLESPFHQFNYYDQSDEVNEVCDQAERWFKSKM